ncbi:MAG: fibronectin type III domain-containing protein, partial [Acidobacteriota bacterium]
MIRLTWNDNSINETNFEIERVEESPTLNWTLAQITSIPGTAGSTVTHDDTSALPGTRYIYRVISKNSAAIGSEYSASYTNVANAQIPQSAPNAPTALTATLQTATSLTLSWSFSGSNAETSIIVQRRPGSNPSASFADIATVKSDITTYVDTGLTEGTSYTYRILARNVVGDSPSPPTIDTATKPSAPSSLVARVDSFTSVSLTWTDNSLNNSSFKVYQRLSTDASFV